MLRQIPDSAQTPKDDRFNENRVGLDHISFSVSTRDELVRAAGILDGLGIRGEILAVPEPRIHILPFRDPDNIQIELTAPYALGE